MKLIKNPLSLLFFRQISKKYSGFAFGPLIFIAPDARNDNSLLAHELVHVRQFWRSWGLHFIRMMLSGKYRLSCELEAYVVSTQHGMSIDTAARHLSTLYDFGFPVDFNTAKHLLIMRL